MTLHPIWQQCWAEKGMCRKGVYFALTRAVILSVQNMVLDPRGTPRYVKSPSAPPLLSISLGGGVRPFPELSLLWCFVIQNRKWVDTCAV